MGWFSSNSPGASAKHTRTVLTELSTMLSRMAEITMPTRNEKLILLMKLIRVFFELVVGEEATELSLLR